MAAERRSPHDPEHTEHSRPNVEGKPAPAEPVLWHSARLDGVWPCCSDRDARLQWISMPRSFPPTKAIMTMNADRRTFLKTTAAASAAAMSAGFFIAPEVRAQKRESALEKIRFACIGVGGKGSSDTRDAGRGGDIVAICDIDDNNLNTIGDAFPKAKKFADYRKLFDEMGKSFDAVTVSTPDHMHAPISLLAMSEGKHCFCQKPMTKSIQETRLMAKAATDNKLVTQMGNQGTANNALREAAAIIKGGHLGKIKEVHVWTDRPIWPQGAVTLEKGDVPKNVHWDLWLGSSADRPYSPAYQPFKWRGFWDFGTGALGDMACHTLNMPFMALDLRDPTSLQAETAGHDGKTFPAWSAITYQFPERNGRAALPFYWYDGGKRPPEAALMGKKSDKSGCVVVGEKGSIYSQDDYCGSFEVLGMDKPKVDYVKSPGHFEEFVMAMKGELDGEPRSNFPNYASQLTETVLLGNLAVYVAKDPGMGKKVEWNAKDATCNVPEADFVIKRDYRDGFGLPKSMA